MWGLIFVSLCIAIIIIAIQTGLAGYLAHDFIEKLHEMMDCGPYTPGGPVCI